MYAPPVGIIWDVDGTLVDTAEHHFLAWRRFAATFGWRNPEIVRRLPDRNASDELYADSRLRKETLYRAVVADHGTGLLPGSSGSVRRETR